MRLKRRSGISLARSFVMHKSHDKNKIILREIYTQPTGRVLF